MVMNAETRNGRPAVKDNKVPVAVAPETTPETSDDESRKNSLSSSPVP